MTINITDNGKGFSMEALPQFGNGLTNMKKRIEQLGGKWEITSKPGEGAKIHMAINFKNENRK
jgi:signal transduction histidine kinase